MELMPIVDELGAKALGTLDEREYVSPTWKIRLLPYGLMWRLPKIFLMIRRAKSDPEAMNAFVQQKLRDFDLEMVRIAEMDASVSAIWEELLRQMFFKVIFYTIPLTVASRYAAGRMEAAAGSDPDAGKLLMALPHNVTTEMGLMLAEAAKLLPEGLDADELEKKLRSGELPEAFQRAWMAFLDAYGFRGAAEIDVAAVRYYDDPRLLIELLISTKNATGETPTQAFERKAREREAAYEAMHARMQANDSKKTAAFEKDYRFFSTFGGYRETHKKYLVLGVAIIRRMMLATARTWVVDGRLDRVDQVFDLTMEQYEAALVDRSLDLRKLGHDNTAYLRKLARVKKPPALIDSRGFIPQPPRPPMKPGEHAGAGVSVGMVRGQVKVLHSPSEKPLLKGEILVARATDPGWTPLFVNAGGIILEIGGSLQHGALVAREYGIPCVAGVEDATTIWKDGALVEVDGTSGIVRTISN
jgi:pyruvate,water dikinase